MGSTSSKNIDGFVSRGGEMPWLNPHKIKIVGLDVPLTDRNWFAFCPRVGEPLEPDWVDDVRQNGVRVAVDVYRDGGAVVMLEGRRRVVAARLVYDEQEKRGVPEDERIAVRVNIRQGTEQELFSINVGSDNRKSKTPLQRAALMAHARKNGASDEVVARMFGCTPQVVKYTTRLLDLAAGVQRAVDAGRLPVREAAKLADHPRDEQVQIYERLEAAGATRGQRASRGIQAARVGRSEEIGRDVPRVRSRAFLERLLASAKKVPGVPKLDFTEVLAFVLGGPMPHGLDRDLVDAFAAAGLREAKAKVREERKGEKKEKVRYRKKGGGST